MMNYCIDVGYCFLSFAVLLCSNSPTNNTTPFQVVPLDLYMLHIVINPKTRKRKKYKHDVPRRLQRDAVAVITSTTTGIAATTTGATTITNTTTTGIFTFL